MILRSWISYPRWQNIREILYDGCVSLGLEFKVTSIDKGFITTTLYYEVHGDIDKLNKFKKRLEKWIQENT